MTAIQQKADNPIAHLSAEDIEAPRPRARRHPRPGDRHPWRPRCGVHPPGHRRAAQARARQPRGAAVLAVPAGLAGRAPPGCRSPRSSRTWRSGTTSCTASGTGCATRRSTRRPGSGTTPRRRTCGSTRTTRCTTPTRTCSASDNDLGYGIMRVDEDQQWSTVLPRPAALQLPQRLPLRVRHRRLRPGDRQGTSRAARTRRASRRRPSASSARSGSRRLATTWCTRCCQARRR